MIKASSTDRDLVTGILSRAFESNQSVNYIIKQDSRRRQRIRLLMEYSFEVCSRYGRVYLSDDKKACALVVYPETRKTDLKAVLADLKLILFCTGISRLFRVLKREALIKKLHPAGPMYYLWFIGVDPAQQQKGLGTRLLHELIADSAQQGRALYLETSALKNLPWYKRAGFAVYHELNMGYTLFFLKREPG